MIRQARCMSIALAAVLVLGSIASFSGSALGQPAEAKKSAPQTVAKPAGGMSERIAARRAELRRLLESAKSRFRPLGGDRVQQARENLAQAVSRLETYLQRNQDFGPGWREYLAFDVLKKSIQPDAQVNPAIFGLFQNRFNARYPGLEDWPFADVGNALRQFRSVNRASTDAPNQAELDKQFEPLIRLVNFTGEAYAPEDLRQASLALGLLETLGEAPEVVQEVRSEFSRPNLFFRVSESFVSDGVRQYIDNYTVTNECSNGAYSNNRIHTTGQVNSQFVPNPAQGVFLAEMRGTALTNTTVHKGPAIVGARATTQLMGSMSLKFDELGVTT